MRNLRNEDLKILKKMCSMRQVELKYFMSKFLRLKYDKVIEKKEYLIAKGNIPIALVAHMDTVFKMPPKVIYHDKEKNVMWSPMGLGADDRAGVFSIFKLVSSGLRPHIILTTDEEIGGLGADAIVKDYPTAPFDIRYLIQLDRRGTDDCVFYDCANSEFTKYVESFGFSEAWGSFSDISILCPEWCIAGVNLSVGYLNEHSEIETLHIGNMMNTISKVTNMLKEKEISFYEYIEANYADYWRNYQYLAQGLAGAQVICHNCGKPFSEEETFAVRLKNGGVGFYCYDCIDGKVGWCSNCNIPYELTENGITDMCPNCLEKGRAKIYGN